MAHLQLAFTFSGGKKQFLHDSLNSSGRISCGDVPVHSVYAHPTSAAAAVHVPAALHEAKPCHEGQLSIEGR
jgi:hypothetical protein